MKRLVWISDCHLDLTTDGIDRNPEIESVINHAVNWAIDNDVSYFVFGGDVFDNTEPSDDAISIFIKALTKLHAAGLNIFVMDGNHEKKSRGKPSCLHFLNALSEKYYNNLHVIHDIKRIKVAKGTYFVFFPHVNKVNIPKEFKSPQDYVNEKADEIIKKSNFFSQMFVFSHLNVHDVIPGTEEQMLKKSEVFLPEHFHRNTYLDKPIPTVLNGHIHSKQKSDLVNIIGSPIFVTFGEKDKNKYFASVDIPTKTSEKPCVYLHKTPCRKFHEIQIQVSDTVDVKHINSELGKVGKRDIVKIDVTVDGNFNYDWEKLRKDLMKKCHHILPIRPRYVMKRTKRSLKQKINLNPKDAVKIFMEQNKPKNKNSILKIANKYIEGCL